MKLYLKDNVDIEETVNELGKIPHITAVDKGNLTMIYYDPDNEIDSEVVRINKDDRRVIFSATSTLFKERLKNKVVQIN